MVELGTSNTQVSVQFRILVFLENKENLKLVKNRFNEEI